MGSPPLSSTQQPVEQGSNRGCVLGCLVVGLGSFALVLILILAANAVLYPWGFFLGGHFHFVPAWQGKARLRSASGADYLLYLRMAPARPENSSSGASVSGYAWLCTPRGARIPLRLGGVLPKHPSMDSTGESIHLNFFDPSPWFRVVPNKLPKFELDGAWGDRQITADDHGSFNKAFPPNATPYQDHESPLSGPILSIQVTLREDLPWYLFRPACPANF